MCDTPEKWMPDFPATGRFRKGNEPKGEGYEFDIIVKPCACGDNLVARLVNGTNWVICEEEKT